MSLIQFGEWLPDQPDFMNAGVTVATNVIPAFNGYKPIKNFVAYSSAATDTIRGIYAGKDDSGNVKLFAGDATKLYEFDATDSGLDDISKAGGYDLTAAEKWRFVQFGDTVIAAGGVGEELQKFQIGTDTAWSNLGGSPPKADFIAVVRDFVWTANIATGSDRIPYRVYWSGFNNSTSWTSGTDQSDFQDLIDSGAITGMVGGEYCTILCERAIFRATYSGLPLVFQFDKVESNTGCRLAGSVCNYGSFVFFLADNGFHMFDGAKSTPIGNEKIDKFFEADFNSNFKDNMSASVDPLNQIAVWSYPSTESTDGTPDRLLIFNYALGRWSIANVNANYIAPFFSGGYTLDNLDNISSTLDGLDINLDSALFRGGEFFFGGALGNKLYSFSGDVLPATIETGEVGISSGKHSLVTRVYPHYTDGTVTVQVGTRNQPSDTVAFSSSTSLSTEGFAPFRSEGRYHRSRFNFSGHWSQAHGLEIEAREIGRR